jgi:hypothetical protein
VFFSEDFWANSKAIVKNTGESGRLIKNYIAALSSGSEGAGRVNSVMNESPQGVLKKLLETS